MRSCLLLLALSTTVLAQTAASMDALLAPAAEEVHADKEWIGVGLLLGWSQRSQVSPRFTFPFSGDTLSFPRQSGPVVTAGLTLQGGCWFGSTRQHGVDANYLSLGDGYELETQAGNGNFGFRSSGSAKLEVNTVYQTADVNYRHRLFENAGTRIDGVLGYRFASLWDGASVTAPGPEPFFSGGRFRESITTWNTFHGGQLGLAGQTVIGPWIFSAAAKMALGNVNSQVELNGATTVLLGLPDGIELESRNRFAVLPSASLQLSRELWNRCRVTVGYEFQYLSMAARSAKVFSDVEPDLSSCYWAQGVTLGLEWRY